MCEIINLLMAAGVWLGSTDMTVPVHPTDLDQLPPLAVVEARMAVLDEQMRRSDAREKAILRLVKECTGEDTGWEDVAFRLERARWARIVEVRWKWYHLWNALKNRERGDERSTIYYLGLLAEDLGSEAYCRRQMPWILDEDYIHEPYAGQVPGGSHGLELLPGSGPCDPGPAGEDPEP